MRTFLRTSLALTALLGAGACASTGPNEAVGDLKIATHLVSGTPDPDGYTVSVSGHGSKPIGVNDTVTFGALPIANYDITLSGIAAGCNVQNDSTQNIYVPVGVKNFTFNVTCS